MTLVNKLTQCKPLAFEIYLRVQVEKGVLSDGITKGLGTVDIDWFRVEKL